MFTDLLSSGYIPFTFALGLMLGLLLLELALMLVGGSLLGDSGDLDADFDADLDVDVDLDGPDIDGPDIDGPELDGPELDGPEMDGPEMGDSAGLQPDAGAGFLSWLGLGKVPFMIWLAAVLLGFGLGGLIIQNLANALLGAALPLLLAVPAAGALALGFARRFGGFIARLMPKSETAAVHSARLGQRRGIISQGTARRGSPAEVRVHDDHGNIHYLRAEPYDDADVIAEGTEVLIIRPRTGPKRGQYWLVAVSD